MRRLAVLAAALVALAVPAAASAHARLLYSTPADGQVVAHPPAAVVLHFDDVVALGPGNAAVDAAGSSVLRSARAHGHVLTLTLDRIGDGSYTARWGVISDDGHTVGGIVTFAVGGGTPHATLSARGGGPAAWDVVARWLLVAGMLLGPGAVVFCIGVARRPRAVALAPAGFVLAAAGAALAWTRVPEGTRYAHAMVAALVAALVAAVLARRPWLALVPALVLVAAPSFGGHALDAGVPRVQVAVDVLHVLAASVWVGGLASLALVLPDAEAARRFSRIALVAVLAIGATGILRAVSELTAWSQLVHTGYGRAIAIKTLLFLALIAVASLSRSHVRAHAAGLRESVEGELLLLAGVVTAVAFLTSLAPGRVASAAPAPAAPGPPSLAAAPGVTAAQALRRLAVAVSVRQAGGRLAVTTTVIGSTGNGVDGLRVSTGEGAAASCGRGCYRSTAPRTRDLHVTVGRDTLHFTLPPFPLADGHGLLRRIGARYLRARTAIFDERLSSGPGQVVTSNWRLAAPASLAFRASDGSAGVIVGSRRWDRQGRGRWVESPQDPRVPQPELPWPANPKNVVSLPHARIRGRRVVRVSLFDPATPAWYVVSADARTDALMRIDMIAPAHFMRDDYSGLDVPLTIRPPVRR